MNAYSATIGRIAISLVFIIEGLLKAFSFESFWHKLDLAGVPVAPFVAILVVLIELGGGVALLIGFNARFFSFVMAIYLTIVSFVMFPFWADFDLFEQFIRNIAIIGGLFMVNSHGAGPSSVDESHVFDV